MVLQQTHANNTCTGVSVSGNIYIGTHGRGIWRSEDYALAQDTATCDLPITTLAEFNKNIIELNLYPNPSFGTICNLEIELIKAEKVKVQIFDISGKLVSSLNKGKLTKGKHTMEIPVLALDAGTYFVNISSGNTSATKKLLVL
jgi:hypothetical protein